MNKLAVLIFLKLLTESFSVIHPTVKFYKRIPQTCKPYNGTLWTKYHCTLFDCVTKCSKDLLCRTASFHKANKACIGVSGCLPECTPAEVLTSKWINFGHKITEGISSNVLMEFTWYYSIYKNTSSSG